MLGMLIRSSRQARGMKQQTLADKVGVTQAYISLLEAGTRRVNVTIDVLQGIADALGIPVEDLAQAATSTQVPPTHDDLAHPPSELFRGIWDDARIQVLEQTWPHLGEADRRDWWRRGHQHHANRAQIQEAARLMEAIQAEQDLLPPLPGGPPDATGR